MLKKGNIVYFRKCRLIDWEQGTLPDNITTNKLYSVTSAGILDGYKEYVSVYGSSHRYHKDHFVKANIELLDITIFEIGNKIKFVDKTPSAGEANSTGCMKHLEQMVVDKEYTVQDFLVLGNSSWVLVGEASGYYMHPNHFIKC